MARLTLVAGDEVESWADPEIEAFYRDTYRLGTPPPTSLAIESHQPQFMLAWCKFWWTAFHNGAVDHRLKELLRIMLASRSRCDYCANLRSGSAIEMGLAETDIARAQDEMGELTSDTKAVLEFGALLASDYTRITRDHYAAIGRSFDRAQIAELLAFSAWQYGGPRMIHTWKSEDYRERDGRPLTLRDLPVRLAYDDAVNGDWHGAVTPVNDGSAAEYLTRTAAVGDGPLRRWLCLLSGREEVLKSWSNLYVTVFDRGQVSSRLKHLLRVRLSQLLDYPEWAPENDQRLRAVDVGKAERQALRAGDVSTFSDQERAALGYAEMLSFGSEVPDSVFEPLANASTEAELVEIGFAVAVQTGVIRVCRSLDLTGAWDLLGTDLTEPAIGR